MRLKLMCPAAQRRLTRLRAELPRDWVVGYMNESTGEIEWPA